MLIGIPVYEGVDLLDVTGPLEMFGWLASNGVDAQVRVLGATIDEVTTRDGFRFRPHDAFGAVPHLDVLWSCGCPAARRRPCGA
ncbi:hypothetical protein [Methylobacterium sp. JK268]